MHTVIGATRGLGTRPWVSPRDEDGAGGTRTRVQHHLRLLGLQRLRQGCSWGGSGVGRGDTRTGHPVAARWGCPGAIATAGVGEGLALRGSEHGHPQHPDNSISSPPSNAGADVEGC